MSIQSTRLVSKQEAVQLAKDRYIEKNNNMLEWMFYAMSDEELENYIDETFTNYSII